MTTQASASPVWGSSSSEPRSSSASAAAATVATAAANTAARAKLVESQPLTLAGEKGAPRLVVYQGRKTAITTTTPARTPA